jgi:hypothetical protein
VSDPDTILLFAVVAVLLLGLGSLLVAWRAAAVADRCRAWAVRDRERISHLGAQLGGARAQLRQMVMEAHKRGWSGLADEPLDPDVTRDLYRTPRDAT